MHLKWERLEVHSVFVRNLLESGQLEDQEGCGRITVMWIKKGTGL
jgi:hypothetical protein